MNKNLNEPEGERFKRRRQISPVLMVAAMAGACLPEILRAQRREPEIVPVDDRVESLLCKKWNNKGKPWSRHDDEAIEKARIKRERKAARLIAGGKQF